MLFKADKAFSAPNPWLLELFHNECWMNLDYVTEQEIRQEVKAQEQSRAVPAGQGGQGASPCTSTGKPKQHLRTPGMGH